MPEGDTVWLASLRMHRALAGRVLTRSDLRVPRHATADLAGRTVTEVLARGKHLLTRMDGDLTLHTHFRMDGSWYLTRPGGRWPGPAHEVRAVLENADWHAVGYRLHDVVLLPTAEESRLVGHLGPDLLGPDWDADEAVRRLGAQPDREIGQALLDQRNLAGIGNLYQAETLFLAGLSPFTPVRQVPDLGQLVTIAARLLRANRAHPEQSTTGSLRRGETHWVYGRARRACRRCGTPVAVAQLGEPPYQRAAYWCPSCQPGPGPAAAASRSVDPASRRSSSR